MDTLILLSRLKSLLTRVPDFDLFSPKSTEHQTWLSEAHALVSAWDKLESVPIKSGMDWLSFESLRDLNVTQIMGAVHRTIAAIEATLPDDGTQAFGPGAVYDFFKSLSRLLGFAEKSIFIIDPYIDNSIFDSYLTPIQNDVSVRLLIQQYTQSVKPALSKFRAQYKTTIDVRASNSIHDRVIVIDGRECWVLGQSIKDAAKAKPNYLAPLSPDVAMMKVADYERIWAQAKAI
jgi:hypothetical protein